MLPSDDNKNGIVVQERKLKEGSVNDVADTLTSDVVQRDNLEDIITEDNLSQSEDNPPP